MAGQARDETEDKPGSEQRFGILGQVGFPRLGIKKDVEEEERAHKRQIWDLTLAGPCRLRCQSASQSKVSRCRPVA
jgi:hypothetical protein